jgi:hypothetical protein
LGERFLAALCADFGEHGAEAIRRVREDEPGVYLRVIARVVPPAMFDVHHDAVLQQLSDEELASYLLAVREAVKGREVHGGGG